MESKKREWGLSFWRKSTGSYCSHFKGLSKEDRDYLIQVLQSEEPVRMVAYPQTYTNPNSPDLVLKFFKPGWEKRDGAPKAAPVIKPVSQPSADDAI